MKMSTSRFAGLLLFGALLVGTPLLSAKDRKDWDDDDNGCKDRDDKTSCSVSVPDSHGAPLLLLTGGVLGVALLVQRRRKVTS
jgi:MYXO-CTERM domain-containing protein